MSYSHILEWTDTAVQIKKYMVIILWSESELVGRLFQNLSLTSVSNLQVVQKMK